MRMTEETICTMREMVQTLFGANGDNFTAQELAEIANQLRVTEPPLVTESEAESETFNDVQRELDNAEWLVSEGDIVDEATDPDFNPADKAWFRRPIRWNDAA